MSEDDQSGHIATLVFAAPNLQGKLVKIKPGRRTGRAATVVGATLGASLLFVTQASAWGGSWNGPGGGGAGDINFSSNRKASWDLTVIDAKKDGYCARIRLVVDRPYWSDYDLYGPLACGHQKAKKWKGSHSTSGGTKMRSLKIEQCRLHSDQSKETCKEVKRISNPKY
ncbi:hypothetical protein AB0I84_31560 [Streptomyces spectabilis]|uniref:hypothetical protein n=1 Tax=Streptomyces spectabilis TaxID=68270 RepID=UPI0033CB8ACB